MQELLHRHSVVCLMWTCPTHPTTVTTEVTTKISAETMRYLHCQVGVRLILCGALIATNCVVHGVYHAHSLDKLSQHPGNAAFSHSHHGHDGDLYSWTHDCGHDAEPGTEECVPHVHLAILGIALTLPAPDECQSNGNSANPVLAPAILTHADRSIIQPQSWAHLADFNAAQPVALTPLCAFAPRIYHPPDNCRAILCDIARGERSGVLLV